MSRRFLAAFFCLTSLVAFAQVEYEEGKHYEVVPVPFEAEPTGLPIVVTEVFSYACLHCYNFEAPLQRWLAKQDPAHVKFERLHVVFSNTMVNLARAYLVSETLGVTEQVHESIFSAIHRNGLKMQREDLLQRLFRNKATIDFDAFSEVFNSPSITEKMRANNGKARVWRVIATPTMVVDGRYTTTPTAVNSQRRVLDVVDFLVQKVLAERSTN